MKLMEKILSEENLQKAIKKVKQNKGAPGMEKMTVQEVEQGFGQYQEEIVSLIMNKQYRPMPVKRVYIPKYQPLLTELSNKQFCKNSQKSMSLYSVNIVLDFDQGEVHIWLWKKC